MDFSIERRDIEDILKKVADKLQKILKKDIQIKKSIDLKNKIINADRIKGNTGFNKCCLKCSEIF